MLAQPSRARDRGTREDERGARVRESAKAREDSSLSKRGRDWPDDQERERSASLSYVLSELKCIPGLTNAILYRDRTPLSSSSGPKIGRRVFSEHQQRPK